MKKFFKKAFIQTVSVVISALLVGGFLYWLV